MEDLKRKRDRLTAAGDQGGRSQLKPKTRHEEIVP